MLYDEFDIAKGLKGVSTDIPYYSVCRSLNPVFTEVRGFEQYISGILSINNSIIILNSKAKKIIMMGYDTFRLLKLYDIKYIVKSIFDLNKYKTDVIIGNFRVVKYADTMYVLMVNDKLHYSTKHEFRNRLVKCKKRFKKGSKRYNKEMKSIAHDMYEYKASIIPIMYNTSNPYNQCRLTIFSPFLGLRKLIWEYKDINHLFKKQYKAYIENPCQDNIRQDSIFGMAYYDACRSTNTDKPSYTDVLNIFKKRLKRIYYGAPNYSTTTLREDIDNCKFLYDIVHQ